MMAVIWAASAMATARNNPTPDTPRQFGIEDFHTERAVVPPTITLLGLQRGADPSGARAAVFGGVFRRRTELAHELLEPGSAGEVTVSWNPQDEMTIGDGSPGYGLRSR
jgi:hypothetical protein